MARPPLTEEELVDRYGPHLNVQPPGGWNAGIEPDREVKTHCCFCGQQCGIILKVKDDEVVGFEPWYEFPFNEGKLCPKGVKRYLQNAHPDRLLHPLERDDQHPDGFRQVSWEHALDRTVAEIQRIQAEHGPDAVAMLSGVSLDNEKSYLVGKFARLALGTANLDYNGRLCMVSAGAANKKALGMDRAPNPWSDIPLADVVFIAGANVAECAPITTSYVWRARDRGAKLIVADPRVTPLARTADVFLGLRPGTDSALMGSILHVLIERDWLDHDFIEQHTLGFEEAAAAVREYTPAWGESITGVPAARIEQAAELWGTSATGMLLHARGIEHHTKGVENVLSCINLGLATGKYGKPGCGVSTITGQGNGQGGREHGHKCDQLPGNRDITNPEHREYIASVWGCDVDEIPGKGLTAEEIVEAIHRGEIKGLLSICFNPVVSLPDTTFTKEALDKLEFYGVIDFFLSETAFHADVVLPGSLHEEDEGTSTNVEGRVIKLNPSKVPPGEARLDWEILLDIAQRLGKGHYFPYTSAKDMFEELRVASSGGTADYGGITWERVEEELGVFWPCPTEDHPGTKRLYEGGVFAHPDGKARFHGVAFRESAEVVDDEYPVWLTTGRVVSQYLSGTQTRRIGPLVAQYPEPLCEIHPRLAEQHGIADGDLVRVTSRRGAMEVPAKVVSTIRPDTVFIPYHWAGRQAANQLTNRALDPVSKIPEYKVSAVRLERVGPSQHVVDQREMDLQ
ncbi:molybdopterin oxidoreductase family protein [Actinomarinicola tropica]|uniref:Molybdopterin-dependent oxidoreductase n=1 Tax=Actinomarinicola tropica TaxID=2789776 RepID=A0A5Q2RU14_9ACTN|nr:molybdopterin oxidoreductase family protein [Actinomarinicola tropica]QGG96705.1 molybdopterin-dependent oxidoreductase [Actinomarinicola tropica]